MTIHEGGKIGNRVFGPFSVRPRPFQAPKRTRNVAPGPLRPPPPRSAQSGVGNRAKDPEKIENVENSRGKRRFGRVREGRTPFEGSRSGRTAKNSVIASDSRDFRPETGRKRPISAPTGPHRPPPPTVIASDHPPSASPASPARSARLRTPSKKSAPRIVNSHDPMHHLLVSSHCRDYSLGDGHCLVVFHGDKRLYTP